MSFCSLQIRIYFNEASAQRGKANHQQTVKTRLGSEQGEVVTEYGKVQVLSPMHKDTRGGHQLQGARSSPSTKAKVRSNKSSSDPTHMHGNITLTSLHDRPDKGSAHNRSSISHANDHLAIEAGHHIPLEVPVLPQLEHPSLPCS